jgi:hypothetical protein
MEYTDGVSLDKADIKSLPEDAQKEFVSAHLLGVEFLQSRGQILTVLHCLQVLRYAQIAR